MQTPSPERPAATTPASERIREFLRDLSKGYAEADVPDRAEEALEALDELQKLHTEEQRRSADRLREALWRHG